MRNPRIVELASNRARVGRVRRQLAGEMKSSFNPDGI
jgi:hypothetical protein